MNTFDIFELALLTAALIVWYQLDKENERDQQDSCK